MSAALSPIRDRIADGETPQRAGSPFKGHAHHPGVLELQPCLPGSPPDVVLPRKGSLGIEPHGTRYRVRIIVEEAPRNREIPSIESLIRGEAMDPQKR